MHAEPLLLPDGPRTEILAYFEPRAAAVDAGGATTREGLEFLQRGLLRSGAGEDGQPDLLRIAQAIATVATADMSTAFALWCHQMVALYLRQAPPGSRPREEILPRLLRAELLGSTALAGAMAYFVCGTPMPVTARADGPAFILDGRIHWASNLCPSGFVQVTSAAPIVERSATLRVPGSLPLDDHWLRGEPIIVVLTPDLPGFQLGNFPRLMALQSTLSAGVGFRGVRVPGEFVISRQFTPFLRRVRPPFLLLQSSFCWGLAHRSLMESAAALQGPGESLRGDLVELQNQAARLGSALARHAAHGCASVEMREIVRLRLEAARLATASVALEAKAVGGRTYQLDNPTNRRLREAAFLPIQAPTEAQLRTELGNNQESGVRSQESEDRSQSVLLTPDS
jgi:alkylation response protein AidB-like acyl-CoA dehydrogenase